MASLPRSALGLILTVAFAASTAAEIADPVDVDPGTPLFLTPLIEKGRAAEGRTLSEVRGLTALKSYSGYFTVNKEYDSNIFFWFYPAVFELERAPLLLWLNGGPGGATMFGNFVENGPIYIDEDGVTHFRSASWIWSHSVLFFDNPVGTGFSFTTNERGYARTAADVTDGLYSALMQFYQLFPEFKDRDLYLTGESYAGKYLPNLGARIHEENKLCQSDNPTSAQAVNLKGLAIGDGYTDPATQTNQFGTLLYNLGLVDRKIRKYIEDQELTMGSLIKKGMFEQGFQVFDKLIGFKDGSEHNNTYFNATGFDQHFNLLLTSSPKPFTDYVNFLDKNNVTRKSIHVGSLPFLDDSPHVLLSLQNDILQTAKPALETLLNSKLYKVLLYNGQLDIIVGPPSVNNFIRSLKWYGAGAFLNSSKTIWRVNGEVAGYRKSHESLTHVLIRNSGHIVPYDQPEWALRMISDFTGTGSASD